MRSALPLAVLSLAALLQAGAQAQVRSGPIQPTGPVQQKPEAPPGQQVLRVPVNVVRLPVTVRDRHGELAFDLGPEDFKVYDNGIPQPIKNFALGGDPLAVILVAENSSRVESLLPGVRSSGIVFTETVMGSNSRAAVITFDDSPQVLVPFTADHDVIEKAISKIKTGDSGARLYDALSRAIEMLQHQPQNDRRVIVAVSESYDSGSEDKLGSVLRDAQLANIAIYTIALSSTNAKLHSTPSQSPAPSIGPPGTFPTGGRPGVPETPSAQAQLNGDANLLALVEWLVKHGVNLVSPQALDAASEATGGDHISTFRDRSIEPAMDRIGGELHAQYTIAYDAPAHGPYGYHEITVTVSRPGYNIRTRPGYFLALPNGSTPASQ
ncbi:MAG TPA: VWA domain-containing protein [Candidatus Acidoferrales bacterium]|nr:VWA domain-containing protein [Candidatus Acidoferrales bacterium]